MGLSRFFRRARWDDERTKELQAYLAQEIDDNIARGMNPGDAARAAHLKLGNTTRIREEIYEMNTLRLLDTLWRDVRYGLRLLVKNPTFAVVAILTLALGTGANAAIFQLVNAVRLRTLPVERPQELASVGIDRHGKGRVGMAYRGRSIHTEAIWDALREQQQAFSSIAAWGSGNWDLSSEGEPQRINGFYVSGNFFETFGVRPHVGRLLTESDDKKGCGTSGAVFHTDSGSRVTAETRASSGSRSCSTAARLKSSASLRRTSSASKSDAPSTLPSPPAPTSCSGRGSADGRTCGGWTSWDG